MNDEDDLVDRDVGEMILAVLDARTARTMAACEEALVRRVRSGEPIEWVFREEVVHALRTIVNLRREAKLALEAAVEQTRQHVLRRGAPQ